MSLPALTGVLNGLVEHSSCSGTAPLRERFALALPDGDVGAIEDPRFVSWLLEHSEAAPFGHGKSTKLDPKVRHAQRLKARDRVQVVGFDLAEIVDRVEASLSPRWHLEAKLADVVVYPEGGKFLRHKDTPKSADLVGTLLVGVHVKHAGGAFVLDDGRESKTFEWGAADPGSVPWVAFFTDVDHEVQPVTAGARVTLVYSLVQTDRPRADPAWDKRLQTLRDAFRSLDTQTAWPVMIACTRHVILDEKKPQPQPLQTLRGLDRDVADALVECGYDVSVRACVVGSPAEGEPARFPTELWSIPRLKKVVPASKLEGMELLTFSEEATADDEEDLEEFSLSEYVLDEVQVAQWVIREHAVATMIHEADCYSDSGYFGNEAYSAHIYSLAAIEIPRPAKRR